MEYYTHPNDSSIKITKIKHEEIDEIKFSKCGTRNNPLMSLDSYYNSLDEKPEVICNGGFFNASTDGAALFCFVDDYIIVSSSESNTGGFQYDEFDGLIYDNFDIEFAACNGYKYFLSGYPILINYGEKTIIETASEINYLAKRTVLAYDNDYVYIVIFDGGGAMFSKMQDILYDMNVLHAINLDGGGSSRLLINGELKTETQWSRPINNCVEVYLKKPEPPKNVFYRVQMQAGAFNSQENAQNLANQINQTKTYSGSVTNAFIVEVER